MKHWSRLKYAYRESDTRRATGAAPLSLMIREEPGLCNGPARAAVTPEADLTRARSRVYIYPKYLALRRLGQCLPLET
jgi:hypothetical protein